MTNGPDPVSSWNLVVKSLIETKKAWKAHREIMEARPGIEDLSIEAQKRLRFVIHRSTTFEIFLEGFSEYWRKNGGIEVLMIPVEKEIKPVKEKENARRKAA